MCVLCGELITSFHWSDEDFKAQMNDDSTIVVGEKQRERLRARLKRAKVANTILSFYGLSLKEWQGSKFLLADKKGTSLIVNDLGDLWHKAQSLTNKKLDMLDTKLLDFLESHGKNPH